MARKNSAPSVSFFAFQDIITSVVGIFVLITLIMMIELVSKKIEGQSIGDQVADTMSNTIALLESDLVQLQQRASDLTQRSSAIAGVQRFNADEVKADLETELKRNDEQAKRFETLNQQSRRVLIAAESDLDRLQQESAESEQDRDELKKLIGKLQYLDTLVGQITADDVMIFRNSSLNGREVTVVDLQPREITVLDLSGSNRVVFSGMDRITKFMSWADKRSPGTSHFLLLVRPGGTGTFDNCRRHLDSIGASYGFDVVSSERALKMRSELGN